MLSVEVLSPRGIGRRAFAAESEIGWGLPEAGEAVMLRASRAVGPVPSSKASPHTSGYPSDASQEAHGRRLPVGPAVVLFEALEPRLLLSAGPAIVAATPQGATGIVDSLTVTFDRPIDPATFTTDDVGIAANPAILLDVFGEYGDVVDSAVVGDVAYVVGTNNGLSILDMTDPSHPVTLGSLRPAGEKNCIDVSGTLACIGAEEVGVYLVDVSDPSNPAVLGLYAMSGYAWEVKISGTRAYVSQHMGDMKILDISDPTAPTLLGTYDPGNYPRGLFVEGETVYTTDCYEGLQIIDATDAANPATDRPVRPRLRNRGRRRLGLTGVRDNSQRRRDRPGRIFAGLADGRRAGRCPGKPPGDRPSGPETLCRQRHRGRHGDRRFGPGRPAGGRPPRRGVLLAWRNGDGRLPAARQPQRRPDDLPNPRHAGVRDATGRDDVIGST